MRDYSELEALIASIIDESARLLPEDTIDDARCYLNSREYGVAFELICDQLYEAHATVTPDLFKLVEKAAKQMGMDDKNWKFVSELMVH